MTPRDLLDWKAFYILEASDQNPEVTRWDDKDSMRQKLVRQAELKAARG